MNLSYLSKVCRFFLLTAIMLPAEEMQRAMRAISYIVFIKILSIDGWNDLPADRVEATDVTIENCSEESCYAQFRFLKRDLRPLFMALRFPLQIRLNNNSVVPSEKTFLMMLHRMAYPRRLTDMEEFFDREYSTISRRFSHVVDLMDEEHSHLLVNNLEFFLPRFPEYNRVIIERIAQSNDDLVPDQESMTAFFIDRAKREICRPLGNDNMQRAVYDGRIKEHNLGFQGTLCSKLAIAISIID